MLHSLVVAIHILSKADSLLLIIFGIVESVTVQIWGVNTIVFLIFKRSLIVVWIRIKRFECVSWKILGNFNFCKGGRRRIRTLYWHHRLHIYWHLNLLSLTESLWSRSLIGCRVILKIRPWIHVELMLLNQNWTVLKISDFGRRKKW